MKILIIIFSILSTVVVLLTAYFEYVENKKMVFICAGIATVLTLTTFALQQIQQARDNEEITRINKLLLEKSDQVVEYTSGGKDNKPLISFNFEKQDDGTYDANFRLLNAGQFPLSNVYYEINDSYTVQLKGLESLGKTSIYGLGEKGIMELNKYAMDHQRESVVQGNIPNIPKNISVPLSYQGKIMKDMPALMYLVKLTWNNESYSAIYQFEKDKTTDRYKILDISINGSDGKPVSNLKEFFPLVPESYWEGFSVKLDTTPKVYQFDSKPN